MYGGFDVFKTYLAVKNHFTTDYDFNKYGGRVTAKLESFTKRPDRYFFHKLSKKYNVLNDINIYERKIPKNIYPTDVSSLNKVSHICITSVDVLKNFSDIYTSLGLKVKKEVFFIAGNKRIEEEIKKNFSDNRTITAENPSNEAMLDIILQHSD